MSLRHVSFTGSDNILRSTHGVPARTAGNSTCRSRSRWQVEARYSLTARELKLVLYVCAMVDSDAKEFGKCRVRVKDFAALADVDTRHLYN